MNFLLLFLMLAGAPALADEVAPWAGLVPEGWKVIAASSGDLNRDGQDDVVLALEENNPANFIRNEGLGSPVLNTNPRRLVVLFNTSDGYEPVLSRDGFLPGENDEHQPCLADPLAEGGIWIERGVLVVRLQEWLSCGSYGVTSNQFTFRFEKNRFRLIGFDYQEFSRSTGEAFEYSVNYLTRKKAITRGLNVFEESRPVTRRQRVSWEGDLYLDEMSPHCRIDDGVSDWCR